MTKVCAPFFGNELLGKVSKITIKEDNVIYLDNIGINIPIGCIERVNESSVDENVDYSVYEIEILNLGCERDIETSVMKIYKNEK